MRLLRKELVSSKTLTGWSNGDVVTESEWGRFAKNTIR